MAKTSRDVMRELATLEDPARRLTRRVWIAEMVRRNRAGIR
jgi:hypothetical protein